MSEMGGTLAFFPSKIFMRWGRQPHYLFDKGVKQNPIKALECAKVGMLLAKFVNCVAESPFEAIAGSIGTRGREDSLKEILLLRVLTGVHLKTRNQTVLLLKGGVIEGLWPTTNNNIKRNHIYEEMHLTRHRVNRACRTGPGLSRSRHRRPIPIPNHPATAG
jgi:hypothetical protein